jgi:hypothetical protein
MRADLSYGDSMPISKERLFQSSRELAVKISAEEEQALKKTVAFWKRLKILLLLFLLVCFSLFYFLTHSLETALR